MISLLKKFGLYILLAGIAVGCATSTKKNSGEIAKNETLIVGLQNGYPPFEFMEADGKIVGFDVELAGIIAQKLGKSLVIKDMEFDSIILSLKQNKIDLIMSGLDITPSRLKEIAMIPYHGVAATSLSLIFWKKIPENVHSIDDILNLSNPSISFETGTTPGEYLKKYHPNIEVKSFGSNLTALIDVKFGKSAAMLVAPDVAEYLKNEYAEAKILNVPLQEDFAILGFGIGVNKKNQQLSQQVEHIIQELKASGELNKLEDKWFKGDD